MKNYTTNICKVCEQDFVGDEEFCSYRCKEIFMDNDADDRYERKVTSV